MLLVFVTVFPALDQQENTSARDHSLAQPDMAQPGVDIGSLGQESITKRGRCSWLPFDESSNMWSVQLTVLPSVEELQTDPQTRAKWIDYSAYDAKATWQLAQALKQQLKVGSASLWLCAWSITSTP